MYVAVKGGEKAIDAAHALQESRRRGNTDLPELSVAQIEQQLNLAVDRVMTEGGIADRELAALALKQASGYIDVSIVPEELGFAVNVGELLITECEMVNGFIDPPDEPPHFTRGYGLVFGMSERKAMAMALVDRALQAPEYGEHATGPAQDEEFVLAHADNVEAAGFVSHLKLPHYVDFQAELELLKRLQQEQNHG